MESKKYILILIIEIYLFLTIILYEYGPLRWETQNKEIFYSLIFLYQLALLMGYLFGIKTRNIKKEEKKKRNMEKYLICVLTLNIFITLLMTVRLSGMSELSIKDLIQKFLIGLTSPSKQYNMKFRIVTYGGSFLTYMSTLLSPLTYTSNLLGLFYFKKVSKKVDILVVISIIFEFSHWIIRGTNKGLFDLVIIFFVSIFLREAVKKKKKKKKKKYILILIFICYVLSIFSKNIMGRLNGDFGLISSINNGVKIDLNQGIALFIPDGFQTLVILLDSYIAQGYYGFSKALSLPFNSTFGIGNSIFLMENLKKILQVDFFQNSYHIKLEEFGWKSKVNWHTFYLWIANDVHFIGVVFVMFMLGYFLAIVFKDFLINKSNLSICLLGMLAILFIYIPANNQLFASPNTAVSFYVISFIWVVSKIKIRSKT